MKARPDRLRTRLPLLPPDATILSPDLALSRGDGAVVFFNASGPIYSCQQDDRFGLRVAGGMLAELGLASLSSLAKVLDVHPSTICRSRGKLKTKGTASLALQRPGPRGRHKLRGRALSQAQRLLDMGCSIREAARKTGVVEGTIRHALKVGALLRRTEEKTETVPPPDRMETEEAQPNEQSNHGEEMAEGATLDHEMSSALEETSGPARMAAALAVTEEALAADAMTEPEVTHDEIVMPSQDLAAAAEEVSGERAAPTKPRMLRAARPEPEAAEETDANRVPAAGDEILLPECSVLSRPSSRSAEDASCAAGVAVKRTTDRALARMGHLNEARPQFASAEAVPGAGALLALPALLDLGLLEVGEKVYGALKNGFFGLRAALLTLAFMALLRLKTPEQLSSHAPGELGLLLGLDRAPEVKTLRRKLIEMGARKLATVFRGELARHWVEKEPEAVGFLYVDGHVRPYHGKKHKLPKAHVPRRRLCLPATIDVWVNDREAQPLFFVTAQATEGMLAVLENDIQPQLRSLVGPKQRITLIFDREGWSPKRFKQWQSNGFDVITYRKAPYELWLAESFSPHSGVVEGHAVNYLLGERSVLLQPGFWMREVRELCEDGHQLSVMTTRQDLSAFDIAVRMFARWKQENFFRYMRQEFALDHLCTNAVEPADPERLVPNPERREKSKELAKHRAELAKLERDYGACAFENPEAQRPTMRGFKISHAELGQKIRDLRQQYESLKKEIAALPARVALHELLPSQGIVQLERDRKTLTDAIKMLAYRAESSLTTLLRPFYARQDEEGRKFLKTVFHLPGDLHPDEERGRLIVRLHGMANPRSNRALSALCEALTLRTVNFPGTRLRLVFQTVIPCEDYCDPGQEP